MNNILPENMKYMINPHKDHCIITFDWLIGQPIKLMEPVYKLQLTVAVESLTLKVETCSRYYHTQYLCGYIKFHQ